MCGDYIAKENAQVFLEYKPQNGVFLNPLAAV